MKNNKIIIATAILATSAIITTNVFAMGNGGGNGNGQGNGKRNGENISQDKQSHDSGDLLKYVVLQDLSEDEKRNLLYSYAEETLAHDMYIYFYEMYGVETFKNIADSESKHIQSVKSLLDRYNIEVPTGYGELTEEFDVLKAEGEKGLKEALEVGVKIEILDINDIADTIQNTDNDDIKIVYTNIGGASFNHLRGFINGLKNNGFTTEIDYSQFLSEEEVNTKGGALKVKMAELVESRGVVLPEKSSTQAITEKCDKEEQTKQNKEQSQSQKNGKGQGMGNGNGYGKNMSSDRKTKNQEMRNNYKTQIEKSYGKSLQKMPQDRLISLNEKIDDAIVKVEEKTTLSDDIKDKYMAIYNGLKDVINSFIR